jgi:hypothetical protein
VFSITFRIHQIVTTWYQETSVLQLATRAMAHQAGSLRTGVDRLGSGGLTLASVSLGLPLSDQDGSLQLEIPLGSTSRHDTTTLVGKQVNRV